MSAMCMRIINVELTGLINERVFSHEIVVLAINTVTSEQKQQTFENTSRLFRVI